MLRHQVSQLGRLFDQWFSTLVSVTLHAGVLCVSAGYWRQPPTVGAMETGAGGDGGFTLTAEGAESLPSGAPAAATPGASLPAAQDSPAAPADVASTATGAMPAAEADASAEVSPPAPPWATVPGDLLPCADPGAESASQPFGVASAPVFPRGGRARIFPTTNATPGGDGTAGPANSGAAVAAGGSAGGGSSAGGKTGGQAGGPNDLTGPSGAGGAGGGSAAGHASGGRAAGVAFGVGGRGTAGPVYPPESLRAGEEGTVVVAVVVSETGAAEEVRVEVSSGFDRLDRRALQWVRRSARFTPALEGGRPVRSGLKIPVHFVLH